MPHGSCCFIFQGVANTCHWPIPVYSQTVNPTLDISKRRKDKIHTGAKLRHFLDKTVTDLHQVCSQTGRTPNAFASCSIAKFSAELKYSCLK